MAIYPNAWADPNAPDYATAPYLETTYAVGVYYLLMPVIVEAWDVTVDLDGGRSPWGIATFKCPVSGPWVDMLDPLTPYPVVISAGYRYAAASGPPAGLNSHEIFAGRVTRRRLRLGPDGETYLEITAESYEAMLDYPSRLAVGVSNAYTKVKQFYDANVFLVKPTWTEPATNATPTAPQLAEYRALSIGTDDDVGDFLRTCASTLGQWMRGDLTSASPRVECITDPYPYDRLNTIPASCFTDLDRDDNLDDWANIVRVTAQWTNASGDKVSKRRTYSEPVALITAVNVLKAVDVTINQKPPGGAVPPANWGPALRWLRRYNASRGAWSGTMRALWWMQPRIDAIQITDAPYPAGAGTVHRVRFDVDAGMMNLQWALT